MDPSIEQALQERDEAVRQRDEAIRERDEARTAYAVGYRWLVDLHEVTGDAFDAVEAPALLWPGYPPHKNAQALEERRRDMQEALFGELEDDEG